VPDKGFADYVAVIRMRVRNAREALSLHQEDVAELCGMSERSYRRFEAFAAKTRLNPTLLSLYRISQALGVTVSELTKEPTKEEIKQSRIPPETVRVRQKHEPFH
jgi:transcriptional regulator with XRE-family HTH domain